MKKMICAEFQPGRLFVGRLPYGNDLIKAIEDFCQSSSIQMATFSLIGAVSSYTIGAYDQKQHVYVTETAKADLEIINCIGNLSVMDGNPMVHAHIILGDEKGNTMGGHLFSDTILFAGEIRLQELIGNPLERAYDERTGLNLWQF
ncbi:MAG: DNA-binding protein [Deltaproteobacteria bacterium]|nr:DNA-binding protein [Deltaproteobacteria bacterium]